jgi:thiol:disulfide interchange protein DsbC
MSFSVLSRALQLDRWKRREGRAFWAMLSVASLGVGASTGMLVNGVSAQASAPSLNAGAEAKAVLAALAKRLPKTAINAVECRGLGGICEVVAGTTLFYVDRGARYLMIGRVYDMETRADLTATRLLALNPDLLVAGAARQKTEVDDTGPPQAPAAPAKVDLRDLPAAGAIHWGPADGPRLVVLSDFACSYCRRLVGELRAIGARVEERPISIFGAASRAAAERVLCASDPARALHAAYEQKEIPAPRKCDVTGLDANEAFAKRHGFGGTPVIIRADGAVLEGYRPATQLKAFVAGGAA